MIRLILFFMCLFFFTATATAQKVRSQDDAVFTGLPDDTEDTTAYRFHKKPNIAVLPFVDANAKAKETEFGRTVSAMLITALRSGTNFSVIERSDLQKLLSEKALDLSGLTQKDSKRVKDLLHVDVILTGDVSLIDGTLQIDARLFDIETSKVVSALYGSCPDLKNIRTEVVNLAKRLEQSYLRQWMGSISISSSLPGAEVYLEGKYVGKTSREKPLMVRDLLEGKYDLKLIRGGYYDWEGRIVVQAKMDRSVKVALIAKPGSMNISSEPDGAKIFLDNTFVGITPMSLKKVAEGEHEIRLVKLNYEPWTRKVVVRSFQPTDVKTTLEVSPGMLSVNSTPAGADIYLKGKFVAKTPHILSNITPGEVVLRVEKKGFEEWTTSAFIEPNEHKVLDIVLKEKTGRLSITSKPEGADVYLGKQGQKEELIGQTPILNYAATIGDYRVRVDKKDFYIATQKARVENAKTSDVSFTLKQKPGVLSVTTYPENARVFLNGAYKGRTPLRIANLTEGAYQLSIQLPYAARTMNVHIKSNRERKVDVRLDKPFSYVAGMIAAGLTAFLFQYLAN